MPPHSASPPAHGGPGGPPPPPGGHHAPYTLPPPRVGSSNSAFPSVRELPSLSSLPRTGSSGSSMSISSMLGGPSMGGHAREPSGPSQYGPPPPQPPSSAGPPGSGPGSAYAPSIHASPRMHSAANDYSPYRRPQTPPDHQRPYDARDPRGDPRDGRDPRDSRGPIAASPQQGSMYATTPEMPRYGTPQSYPHPQRGPPPPNDHQQQQARMAAGIPRPNSQPKTYPRDPRGPPPPGEQQQQQQQQHGGPPPPHPDSMYGRRDEHRGGPPHPGYSPDQRGRVPGRYEDQQHPQQHQPPQHPLPYLSEREQRERERERDWDRDNREPSWDQRAREIDMRMRDRERRDRANTGGSDPGGRPPQGPTGPQGPPPPQSAYGPGVPMYGRPPDSREPSRDPRDMRDPHDVRDPRDPRADPRDVRDPRDPRGDPRDPRGAPPASWRAPYDQQGRPYEHGRPNDYPPPSAGPGHNQPPPPPPPPSQYPPHGPPPPGQDRYPPTSLPPSHHQPGGPSPYESPDRNRMGLGHPQGGPQGGPQGPPPPHQQQPPPPQQQQQHGPPRFSVPPRPRPMDEAPPPPSVAYSGGAGGNNGPQPPGYDTAPPRQRSAEEGAHHPPRNLLAIQEMNRRGRVSPLPQAVQGAQSQIHGPAGEPSIKSEFGRMYVGIGNGVGMGLSSPITSGATLPFSNGNGGPQTGPGGVPLRREDSDSTPHDSTAEPPAKPAKGKRRKAVKDDPAKAAAAAAGLEDDGSGRATPAGAKAKRAKTAHHHHHHHHAHHHHHHPDQTTSPSIASPALKNGKGATPIPLPASVAGPPRDYTTAQIPQTVPRSALQQPLQASPPQQSQQAPHLSPSKQPNGTFAAAAPIIQAAPAVIKPKQIVLSQAVVDSVADQPRYYLGDVLYEPKLKTARKCDPLTGRPPRYPYSTTPRPLPIDMIRDKANSILTVKVNRLFLESAAREEITHRRALWGTDIYTDDSDVVAACIHGGWIRGEWPDDVDVDMLGLLEQADALAGGTGTKETMSRKQRAAAAAALELARSRPPPELLEAPLKTGPMTIPAGRDLHVTLLVLPTLVKYSATTRFGIRSREWGGQPHEQHQPHDGMSFKILKIRWVVNGAGAQSRLRGKARRERMRQAMREVEIAPSQTEGIKLGFGFGDAMAEGEQGATTAGNGDAQWWRPPARMGETGEGDKENRAGSAERADAAAAATEINGNKDIVAAEKDAEAPKSNDTKPADKAAADKEGPSKEGPFKADGAVDGEKSTIDTTAEQDPDTTMTDAGMDD
ncbi:hypothetical protein Sste5344_007556 [Sporothrix stenoceras]